MTKAGSLEAHIYLIFQTSKFKTNKILKVKYFHSAEGKAGSTPFRVEDSWSTHLSKGYLPCNTLLGVNLGG